MPLRDALSLEPWLLVGGGYAAVTRNCQMEIAIEVENALSEDSPTGLIG
jgi:hypothetical protein